MKKSKLLTSLIVICIFACLSLVLTGCSSFTAASYDYLVTFNYNTDGLELETTFPDQYLGVNEGCKIMRPVKPSNKLYQNSDFKEHQINRYEVVDWYTAKYDENGEVMRGDDGRVLLDRRWNFNADKVTSDLTLYAFLEIKPSVSLFYDGKVQKTINYIKGTTVTQSRFVPVAPKWSGHTFYDYYEDAEMTKKFTFPITIDEEDVVIYARFIDGENWSIVKTAEQFNNSYHASAKIYLDDDVDFKDVEFKNPKLEFSGEINGNGHTVKNINVTISTDINSTSNMGLFGVLRSTAYIRNVTFENISVTVNTITKNPAQAAMFAARIDSGAKLEKVRVINGSISEGSIAAGSEVSLYGLCINQNNLSGVTITDCDFDAIEINYKEP